MVGTLITLAIFIAINIVISLFIYFKKKSNRNTNDEKSYTFHFGTKFFATALLPTILLVIMVANSFFEFVIIYVYLIALTLMANKQYNDAKNKE